MSSTRLAALFGCTYDSGVSGLGHLKNTVSDIKEIKKILEKQYLFQSVPAHANPNYDQIENGLSAIGRKAAEENAELVFVYMSGHGFRIDLETYYVPENGKIQEDLEKLKCISVDFAFERIRRAGAKSSIIIVFDCCRALDKSKYRMLRGRWNYQLEQANRWQYLFDTRRFKRGELIVFSTELDEAALAGAESDESTTFGKHFSETLKETDLDIVELFKNVKVRIENDPDTDQKPDWNEDRLMDFRDMYLRASESRYKLEPHTRSILLRNNITDACILRNNTNNKPNISVAVGLGKQTTKGECLLLDQNLRKRRGGGKHGDAIKRKEFQFKPYCLASDPCNERVAIGGANGSVWFWKPSVDEFNELKVENNSERLHAGAVNSISFTRSGSYLISTSVDKRLRITSVSDGTCFGVKELKSWGWSISVNPINGANEFAVGCKDGTVRFWTLPVPVEKRQLNLNFAAGVRSVAYSNDGEMLAVGTQKGYVAIYSRSGPEKKFGRIGKVIPHSISLSERDIVIGMLCLYRNKHNKKLCKKIFSDSGYIYHIERAINISDKPLESMNGYDREKREESYRVIGHCKEIRKFVFDHIHVRALDFSPDKRVLMVGYNIGAYCMYDIESRKMLWPPFDEKSGHHTLQDLSPTFGWSSSVQFDRHHATAYVANGRALHRLEFR